MIPHQPRENPINTFRIDRNNIPTAPCGMNGLLYIGDSEKEARRLFNGIDSGINQWGKEDSTYGLVLSKWDSGKNDYVTIDSKGFPPSQPLEVNANWQTQARGTNDAEYQIYIANAESLGWVIKSYDEWLNS
jgi:hypothetical protein